MREVSIRTRFDILESQRQAKDFAAELGFPKRACHELAIVASELASNILKYAHTGTIVLAAVEGDEGRAIEVRACDAGPPFRNVEQAFVDGCDDTGPVDPALILRRGGLGAGLGAVARLTHQVRVEQGPHGKCVSATRYLGRRLRSIRPISPRT